MAPTDKDPSNQKRTQKELEKSAQAQQRALHQAYEETQKILNALKEQSKILERQKRQYEDLNELMGLNAIKLEEVEKPMQEYLKDLEEYFNYTEKLQQQLTTSLKQVTEELFEKLGPAAIKKLDEASKDYRNYFSRIINDILQASDDVQKAISSIGLDKRQQEALERELEFLWSTLGEGFIDSEQLADNIKRAFEDVLKSDDVVVAQQKMAQLAHDSGKVFTEMANKMQNLYQQMPSKQKHIILTDEIKLTLKEAQKLSDFFKSAESEQAELLDITNYRGQKFIGILLKHKLLTQETLVQIANQVQAYKNAKEEANKLLKTEKERAQISWKQIYEGLGIRSVFEKNLFELGKTANEILTSAHRNYAILIKDYSALANTKFFAEVARFSTNMEQAVAKMGAFTEELKTTQVGVLQQLVLDVKDIELATGASTKHVVTFTSEMRKSLFPASKTRAILERINKETKLLGLNTRAVVESLSDIASTMMMIGWGHAVDAMGKVAMRAEQMRISLGSVTAFAEIMSDLEPAIEAATTLQLMGGLGSYYDPMQLLAASVQGPEQTMKILENVFKDIGRINEEGQYVIDRLIDRRRLEEKARVLGINVSEAFEIARKQAEISAKQQFLPPIRFEGLVDQDGNPIDPETIRNVLLESIDFEGKVVKGSVLQRVGIKDITKLTKSDIERIWRESKSLEETALERNQTFKESVDALSDIIQSLGVILNPFIEVLRGIMQFLAKTKLAVAIFGLTVALKFLPAAFKIFGNVFSSVKSAMSTLGNIIFKKGGLKNIFTKEGLKNIFKFGDAGQATKAIGKAQSVVDRASSTDRRLIGKPGAGIREFMKQVAMGIRYFGHPKVLRGTLGLLASAPALLVFAPAAVALLPLAAIGALGKLVLAGFKTISQGISSFGNPKMLKGLLALTLVSASLVPFAFALKIFNDVEWDALLKAGVALLGFLGIMIGVGALLTNPAVLLFAAIGAATFAAIGLSLAALGGGLLVVAKALDALGKIDASVATQLVETFKSLSAIVPFTLLLGNPLTLLGFSLAAVNIIVLAKALKTLAAPIDIIGNKMERFTEHLRNLVAAAREIDSEVVRNIKRLGSALGDVSSGVSQSTSTRSSTVTNTSDNRTSSRPIVVQLVLPSGKVLQEQIIKDVEKYG